MLTHRISPDFCGSVYLFIPPYAFGPVPSLPGHAIAYRWRSLPRVLRHRASSPQGSSSNGCYLCRSPWTNGYAPLFSHTHYRYKVGTLKVWEAGVVGRDFDVDTLQVFVPGTRNTVVYTLKARPIVGCCTVLYRYCTVLGALSVTCLNPTRKRFS